jgi:DNA polymerase-3 subunit gamma/tau
MAKHFRDLLVAREPKTVVLLEVGPAIKERYLQQSASSSTRFLLHGLKVFNELDGQYKSSSQPRILVELGLLKLVEFISQEKKKSQLNPSEAPSKGTDDYLPKELPKRSQAPLSDSQPTEAPAVIPVNPELPQAIAPATPPASRISDTPRVPEATKPIIDSELPPEPVLADRSPMEPPVATLDSAFDAGPLMPPAPAAPASIPSSSIGTQRPRRASRGVSLMQTLDTLSNGSSTPEASESGEVGGPIIPAVEEGPQGVFTEFELKNALEKYVKQRHVKTAVRSLLLAQVPKIVNKSVLEIELDNNIQLGFLNEEQQELIPYLRTTLGNGAIRFEIKMVEREQTRKLYLPEEKFKYMAEKNPNLVYLRQKIQTDLE